MATDIPPLSLERAGPWTYTADNGRAEIRIGMEGAEGSFSPVELLMAALAGCAALSAEAQLAHRLGEDFQAASTVEATFDAEENRIVSLLNHIAADMSALAPERREKLITSTERSISRLCTVKRSLNQSVESITEVSDGSR